MPVTFSVVDGTGRAVATVGDNVVPRSTPATEGHFRRTYPVAENGWTVEARLPATSVFAPVSGLQSRFLAVGLLVAALCSVAIFFPMRFLVQPLGRLRDAARRIRAGEYDARVLVDSQDEVGELAESFNHMAAAVEEKTNRLRATADELRARQIELRAQHERVETVIRSLHEGIVVVDGAGRPVMANAAAAPLLERIEAGDAELHPHGACEWVADGRSCSGCLAAPAREPETCHVNADDRVLEVTSARLPAGGGGDGGLVLVSRDVTERVEQAERNIHRERLTVLGRSRQ